MGWRLSDSRHARSRSRPPVELTITISMRGESVRAATAGQRTMHRRMASTRVSAIVVNYRRPAMTCACLEALREALSRVDGSTEVVVVDNGSGDDSTAAIREAMPEAM